MAEKKKILWIVDGKGWGWDTKARELSKRLPTFAHQIVNPTLACFEDLTVFKEDILKEGFDVIVCFAVTLVNFFAGEEFPPVITSLTSSRIIDLKEERTCL